MPVQQVFVCNLDSQIVQKKNPALTGSQRYVTLNESFSRKKVALPLQLDSPVEGFETRLGTLRLVR